MFPAVVMRGYDPQQADTQLNAEPFIKLNGQKEEALSSQTVTAVEFTDVKFMKEQVVTQDELLLYTNFGLAQDEHKQAAGDPKELV